VFTSLINLSFCFVGYMPHRGGWSIQFSQYFSQGRAYCTSFNMYVLSLILFYPFVSSYFALCFVVITAGRVTYTSRAKPVASEMAPAETPIEGNTVVSNAP
jgi:uncharacterized membrane protein